MNDRWWGDSLWGCTFITLANVFSHSFIEKNDFFFYLYFILLLTAFEKPCECCYSAVVDQIFLGVDPCEDDLQEEKRIK